MVRYTNKIPINRRIYDLLQMVQRETHPANRPPAPFDPLQPEVQLRGRKMKKEKREIKRKREREKKHGINGIKKKRGQKREREEEKKRKRSRWTPDIERGCRVGSVRRVIDIRIFGRTAIFSLLVLFFFFFFSPLSFSIPLPGGGLRHQPNPLPTPFGAPLTSAGFLSSLHRNSYSPSRRRSINILISRCCGI